jgi:hypothetical protein
MVNWVLPAPQSTNLSLAAGAANGTATIGVDTLDNSAYKSITARIVDPSNKGQTITLEPTAPNHYQAQTPAGQEGSYLIDVQAALKGSSAVRSVSGGLVVPYSPEYRDMGDDPVTMQAIAAAGGGSVIASPLQAFANNLAPVDAPTPLQTLLLLLALALLPIDVAARRLVLSREDWRALLAALSWWRRVPAEASPAPAFAPLAGLRERRAHRRGAAPAIAAATDITAATDTGAAAAVMPPSQQISPMAGSMTASVAQGARERRAPADRPTAGEAPRAAPAPAAPNADTAASATSRLLDAKRRRRAQ